MLKITNGLLAILLLFALAACGGDSDTDDAGTKDAEPAKDKKADAAPPETKAPETKAPEKKAPEPAAPVLHDYASLSQRSGDNSVWIYYDAKAAVAVGTELVLTEYPKVRWKCVQMGSRAGSAAIETIDGTSHGLPGSGDVNVKGTFTIVK